MTNALYFGDNLHVLREYVKDETVDLIYLDPPFNSNATYNVLFKAPSGRENDAQAQAFVDTWHWAEEAESAYHDVLHSGAAAAEILRALRSVLGENDLMAYLAMMTVRLLEMHRVLKRTGSLYLHCDPTASHYLKVILDSIFSEQNFTNEVVWERATPKGLAFTRFASNHDIIFMYRKGNNFTWNPQYLPHREGYVEKYYNQIDAGTNRRFQATSLLNPNQNRPNLTYEFGGHTRVWRWTRERMELAAQEGRIYFPPGGGVPREKRYLDEQEGMPVSSVWTDISPINSQAQERLGFPTQKPIALLERIINASSNEGDVVLDPFCGCGTAIHAAQKLHREWVGIDITHIAVQIIEDRIRKHFPMEKYHVEGRPVDLDGARNLADRDKYQFQWWATSLIKAQPRGGHKKGPDRGVDGVLYFKKGSNEDGKAIVSVKGGKHIGRAMIGDLIGTRVRENAEMAIFITLEPPTPEMIAMAASDGFIGEGAGRAPRCQILTVEQLLAGQGVRLPAAYDTVTARDEARRQKAPRKPKQPDRRQQHLMLPLEGGRATKEPAFQLDVAYKQPRREYPMAAEEGAKPPAPPKRRRKAG